MARKQVAVAEDGAKSTKSAKTHKQSRNKMSKRSRNGAPKQLEEDDEAGVQIAPDSSSDSEPFGEEEDADVVSAEEGNEYDSDDDAEEEGEVENVEEGESNNNKKNKNKKNKKNKSSKENGNVMETTSLWRFPMHRVSRIIKREDPNIRISQEAVYLINKASEKFLQLFSMEAYACAFLDRKKTVAYKNLSSVVTKRRRFNFLSDFVPERLKAEDALKEMPSVEMS